MMNFKSKKIKKLTEDATPANTAGVGDFSFGNNPMNPSDTSVGSGENTTTTITLSNPKKKTFSITDGKRNEE